MSEDRFLPKPDKQDRNFEILHGPVADVVVRKDIPEYAEVKLLASEFSEGFPPRWITNPQAFGTYVDNLDNPKYLIKDRRHHNMMDESGKIKSRRLDLLPSSPHPRPAENASLSVVNEILMTRDIKAVLSSDELQQMVREQGFSGLDFAEPLFAVTTKKPLGKFVCYRYISGQKNSPHFAIVDKLRNLLLEKGIEPYDLQEHQFIVSYEGTRPTLYLLDVEGYHRIQKHDN